MCRSLVSFIPCVLSLFSGNLVNGGEIRQPASVLPWTESELSNARPLPRLTSFPEVTEQTPTWHLDTSKTDYNQLTKKRPLPMVEKDHYASLGGIPSKGIQSGKPHTVRVPRQSAHKSETRLANPMSLFLKHR